MKFINLITFITVALAQTATNNNSTATNNRQNEVDVYNKCLSSRNCGLDNSCQEGCAGVAYNQTAKYIGDLQNCIRSCNSSSPPDVYYNCYVNCDKNTNINTNIPSNSSTNGTSNTNPSGKSSGTLPTYVVTWTVVTSLSLLFMTV